MPSKLMPQPFLFHLPASPLLAVTFAMTCALVAGSTNAQSVYEVNMTGQLLNVTKNGLPVSCGYRIIVTSNNDGSRGRRVLDASLFVSKGAMITKFVGRALPPGVNGLENLVEVPIYGGWLKAPGNEPAAPLAELPPEVPAPPPTMRVVNPQGAIAVVDAIGLQHPIQVGVSWTPKVESIYSGKVEIGAQSVDQFYSCVSELKGAISEKINR
jgi:hypothetical protein